MPTIDALRKQIEDTDAAIIQQLAKRQELSKQIGQLKSHHGKDIIDSEREEALFAFYETLSEKYHLQASFVKQLFKRIIAHSRKVQAL